MNIDTLINLYKVEHWTWNTYFIGEQQPSVCIHPRMKNWLFIEVRLILRDHHHRDHLSVLGSASSFSVLTSPSVDLDVNNEGTDSVSFSNRHHCWCLYDITWLRDYCSCYPAVLSCALMMTFSLTSTPWPPYLSLVLWSWMFDDLSTSSGRGDGTTFSLQNRN